MVSLRRRRLLGLCSGGTPFVTPLPLCCENLTSSENATQHAKPKSEHPLVSDDASILDSVGMQLLLDRGTSPERSNRDPIFEANSMRQQLNIVVQEEPVSSNVSGSSSSKEQLIQQITGPAVKHRKRHRRKNWQNQEQCVMRGVYFKNMKWQAAIKVDKKQIHLGTVGSQEEAAHLYNRAAFMCGREPNFELPEEEKQELRKFKWNEFLTMTRHAITRKKHKRRHSSGADNNLEVHPLDKDGLDNKHGFYACEDAKQET